MKRNSQENSLSAFSKRFSLPHILDIVGRGSSLFGILSRASLFKYRFYICIGILSLAGETAFYYINAREALMFPIWLSILMSLGLSASALLLEPYLESLYREYLYSRSSTFKIVSIVLVVLVAVNFIITGAFRSEAHTNNRIIESIEANRSDYQRQRLLLENSGGSDEALNELEQNFKQKEASLLKVAGSSSLEELTNKTIASNSLFYLNISSGALLGILASLMFSMALVLGEPLNKMRAIEKVQKLINQTLEEIEHEKQIIHRISDLQSELETLEEKHSVVASLRSKAQILDSYGKANYYSNEQEYNFEIQDIRTEILNDILKTTRNSNN